MYQRLSGDAQQLLPFAKGGKRTQGWGAGLGQALASWLRAMAMFAVPAACYFVTNNLCFYALQIMPAHTYTLLSDLKIITTGVLSYLLLDKQLNRRAATCLLLLFTGICLGQYGTSGSKAHTAATPFLSGPGPLHWLHGVLVMSLVAVLSAVAAVYTEWVMYHSDGYKHESINLQNMRLYASGTLFNGLYCVSRGAGSLSSFDDMRPSHWVIVMGLAFMGLVTSLVIKRYYGNVVKVYASCIASLVAAGASSWVLHDPPTPVFFIGCLMAMTATFQFRAGQQSQPAPASAAPADGHQPDGKQPAEPGSPQATAKAWRATAFIPAIAGLVLVLFLACQATRPTSLNSSSSPNQPVKLQLGNTTDAPMMPLPPYPPACLNTTLVQMHKSVCPILDCKTDATCSTSDPGCCAYLNARMLTFFDAFLKSKCLQGEYLLVHGTALGAVRDSSIIPGTEDVDVGATPLLLQYMELNSTKELLWKHGYALFYFDEFGWWKLCPHKHHPDPEFRAAFKALGEPVPAWEARTGRCQAVYLDLWPMWPIKGAAGECNKAGGILEQGVLDVPWDTRPKVLSSGAHVDTCLLQKAGLLKTRTYDERVCSLYVKAPWRVAPYGESMAQVGNGSFPVAKSYEKVFDSTYGTDWRAPRGTHGLWPQTHDGFQLVWHLVAKLSVTAWGNMPLQTRENQCKQA